MPCLSQRHLAETPAENARTWQAPMETVWVSEDACLEDEWDHLWTDVGGEG